MPEETIMHHKGVPGNTSNSPSVVHFHFDCMLEPQTAYIRENATEKLREYNMTLLHTYPAFALYTARV